MHADGEIQMEQTYTRKTFVFEVRHIFVQQRMGVKYHQFLFLTNCEGISKYKMLQALDIELKGASEVKISAIWQL